MDRCFDRLGAQTPAPGTFFDDWVSHLPTRSATNSRPAPRPGALPDTLDGRATTLEEMLVARVHPGAPADTLLSPGRSPLPADALLAQTRAMSGVLRLHGVLREDRVAVVLGNGPEMAAAFFAVAHGAIVAPLNPAYTADEFKFYLEDLRARALIVEQNVPSVARAVAAGLGVPVIELIRGARAGEIHIAPPAVAQGAVPPSSDAPAPGDVALVLHTSGTTSRPKQVPLTHANLCCSAHHIAGWLELGPADRSLNIMPLFHIHGLVAAVLSSIAAGGSVVCTPGLRLPAFFGWLEEFRPSWYTAVPTMHDAIVGAAPSGMPPGTLRFIRSSSLALPRRTYDALEATFGVPVIEAYGMTEAAHQMASNPVGARVRKPGTVGLAAGPEIAIMDGGGKLLDTGETGEVVIRGPNVTSGYVSNPSANAAAFTKGWFRTGDQGVIDADGYLALTGRLKEIINRGGEKIAPIEIDEVLRDHPAVRQALTFALPHPTLGEEVAAVIVLRDGASVSEKQLREFVAVRLSYARVPRKIVIADALPTGPTGKPQRIGLAERLGLGSAAAAVEAPANDTPSPVEEIIWAIWEEVLRCPPRSLDADFFDAGGDSLRAMLVVARTQELLACELTLLEFFDAPSVRGIARVIEPRLDVANDPPSRC